MCVIDELKLSKIVCCFASQYIKQIMPFNVNIRAISGMETDARLFRRTLLQTGILSFKSIYNISLAVLRDTKLVLQRDMETY